MELGPRDRLSQAFVHEMEKGRTADTPYGPVTYLDLRHLGEKLIDTKLPFVRELCLKYERIDPVHELVPVRPVVHYMMGGVHTDIDGATPLAGLYAAGETACVTINGANRLGSNSLPECLVFGARAGRAAAEYASAAGGTPSVIEAQATDEVRRLERDLLGKGPGTESIAAVRDDMQATMEEAAGIFRTGPALSKGADTLAELQERVRNVGLSDTSRSFNTELVAALELANMLDISECILQAGMQREESRGAPAHRLSRPRRQTLPDPPVGAPQSRRDGAGRAPLGDHHSLAPGRGSSTGPPHRG
jgi:fumarate reductase flavoprotein subunit